MAIYVGNLNYRLGEQELSDVFSEYGEVTSVKIIKDRNTGRSKGFGFVELSDDASEDRAIQELDGKDIGGRNLRVNKANQKS